MICPATPTGSFSERLSALSGTGLTWPVDFGGKTAVVLEAGGNVADVVFGFDDGLATVAGFEFGEAGCVLANSVGQLEEYAAAILRGAAGPWPVFEGLFGGMRPHGQRPWHCESGTSAMTSSVEGSYTGKVLPLSLGDPFAVDVHLVGLRLCGGR